EVLHAMTSRHGDGDAPFVELNCAAVPGSLLESQLFGHEPSAAPDVRAARRGLLELAAGGTLFLDEIVELPPRAQAKVVRFLQGAGFRRLGGQRVITVALRVVAATTVDCAVAVAAGRLREDLYHRLMEFAIQIPPLSSRTEDIPDLARRFMAFFAE